MHPYTPLWKRGARGDFTSIILKSPFIPLCQRGIKTPETEGLLMPDPNFLLPVLQMENCWLREWIALSVVVLLPEPSIPIIEIRIGAISN